MAHVTVLGAGLGGVMAAYELRKELRAEDKITLIGKGRTFQFVPSNPWVAVGWRDREEIEVDLVPVMARKSIQYIDSGAAKLHADRNEIELGDGTTQAYDYLVIATGPDLAFDEIEGLGPQGHTQSVCDVGHAQKAKEAFDRLVAAPGPVIVGAVQGASCFGPAYEFAFILDTELKRRKLRDKVPMTFVTSEPYIGHLGLGGVGDTKGLLESEMRNRHINWVTNAKVEAVSSGSMRVVSLAEDGTPGAPKDIPFTYAMMLPAFRGVKAILGIEGLTNPRGFVLTDKHQRNPAYPNIFAVGVCIAIAPVDKTPVPVGVPKTGFMIESMVAATAKNISQLVRGQAPTHEATWNAICLADFGDSGVAFVAQPEMPPRNVNWAAKGRWVHYAKVAFESYFLRRVRRGQPEPFFESILLEAIGIHKLKKTS